MTSLIHQTHALGSCALTVAALTAGARRTRPWLTIAAMLATMAVVIVTDATWLMHDAIQRALIASGAYPRHAAIQLALTAAAVLLLTGAACWTFRSTKGGIRWGWVTVIVLVALFVVQAISIHAVDAMLVTPLGPAMLIGWLWLAGGGAVVAATLADRPGARH